MKSINNFAAILLLLIFSCIASSQQIYNINNCGDLVNINSVINQPGYVTYNLLADIDCANTPFTPIGSLSTPLNGITFNGNNHVIRNVKISSNTNYTGIFRSGNFSQVNDLKIENINILSNASYIGALFGNTFNVTISNCHILSGTINAINNLKNISSLSDLGGFVGTMNTSVMFNCTVTKLTLFGNKTGNVGGLVGSALSSTFYRCTNIGFPSMTAQPNFLGQSTVGGLIGFCASCDISESGISQGNLRALGSFAGGIVGFNNIPVRFSRLYSRPDVTINGLLFVGGLAGSFVLPFSNYTHVLDNSYSVSKLSGQSYIGGLVGGVTMHTNDTTLIISNSYSNANLTALSSRGMIFGSFYYTGETTGNPLIFNNVFFNNASNLNYTGSSNLPLDLYTGNSCNFMYNQILSNFDVELWGGDRLKTEYNFAFGENTCPKPKVCFYVVPNCLQCSEFPTVVDPNFFNISCQLLGNQWTWVFANKTSNTINSNSVLTINGSTYIQGNFSQGSGGNLVFFLSNNGGNLNVSGCVTLNGTISVIVSNRPDSPNSVVQLVNYNCSKAPEIQASQISVKPTYSKCDQYSATPISQQNTLSVSLSYSGGKCPLSRNTILGITFGIGIGLPLFVGLIFLICIIVLKIKQNLQSKQMMNKMNKQKPNDSAFVENKKFDTNQNGGTKWTENNTDLI